jgi:hypothetical protein
MSALSRELLERISEWSEALGAIFGILAATSVVVYLLANKPLRKMEARESEIAARKMAGLEKDASDAKAAQQGVETELANQKERTAIAEKAASDAALALERFKQPRSLSIEQQDKLKSALKPFAGQNFALAVFPDPEALALVRVLDTLLKSVGWNRVPSQIHRESGGQSGLLVDVAGVTAAQISDSGVDAYIAPDDADSVLAQHALSSILNTAGIHCENHRTPQLTGKTPRAITVSVGKKPVEPN